jgi:hypothetical protein
MVVERRNRLQRRCPQRMAVTRTRHERQDVHRPGVQAPALPLVDARGGSRTVHRGDSQFQPSSTRRLAKVPAGEPRRSLEDSADANEWLTALGVDGAVSSAPGRTPTSRSRAPCKP